MNPSNVLYTANTSQSVDWNAIASSRFSGEAGPPTDERGFIEKTGDFITGAPRWAALSVGSALTGLANTVPLIANAVGGQGTMEYLSTLEFAENLDRNFASGSSMQDFYNAHSEGVELTGAIVGGIAPGGLAVKGARIAGNGLTPFVSRMAAMESDHIIGKSAAWLGGMVETSSKTRILRGAYDALLVKGESAITGFLPPDRIKFMLASGAKLGAEAVAFELGATLTQMHNPTYKDINDLGDFTKHIAVAGAFGGGLGGVLGMPLWKSASFLPSVDALAPVTLRDTAQVIERTRRSVNQTADFGEGLNSIPLGTKIATNIDDLSVTRESLEQIVNNFAGAFPASKQDQARKTIGEWISKRDAQSDFIIKSHVLELVPKGSNLGDDLMKKVIKGEDGQLLNTPEALTQLFDGATAVKPLRASVSAKGISVDSVVDITEDTFAEVQRLVQGSSVGGKAMTQMNTLASLKEGAKALGFKLTDATDRLTPAQLQLKNSYNALKTQINSQEHKILDDILSDPRSMTEAHAKFLGVSPSDYTKIKGLVDFEATPSISQTYDMVLKQFVDRPIAVLGDILEHPKLFNPSNGGLQINGQRILVSSVAKELSKLTAPNTSLSAQVLWETATVSTGKQATNIAYKGVESVDNFFKSGDFNPYKLAHAIDKDILVSNGTRTLTTDEALTELTKAKLTLYREGISKNMSEIEARLYADLPQTEDLATWVATKGRENNFLERRNVVIDYNKMTPLNEFDVKTAAGMRREIFGQQLAAAEQAFRIATEDLKLTIPESIKGSLAELREFGLNGAMPIDAANASGARAFTNANGKMFKLNTVVSQFGTFVNNLNSKQRDEIIGVMAPEFQRMLRGTSKNADLDALRVLQTKITGGGDKWYNVEALGLTGNGDTLTLVNREVAQLLVEAASDGISPAKAEALMTKARDLMATGSPTHIFTVENANVASLIRAYSSIENKSRTASVNIMGAKGYNVPDNIPGQLYFPPTDVARSPYFVMVRSDADAAIGGTSGYSFVHANSSKALSEKVDRIRQEFGNKLVIKSKDEIVLDKKLQAEFEHAKAFYSYSVDSELQSKGIFSELLPRTGEEIMGEMQKHLTSKAASNTRFLIKTMSGDFLNTLDRLSASVDQYARSTHGKAIGAGTRGVTPDNTYSQLARSFLDIAPDENAEGILGAVLGLQNKLVDWTDSLGDAARNLHTKSKTQNPARLAEFEKRLHDIVAEGERLGMDFSKMTAPILMDAEEKYGRSFVTRAVTQSVNAISATLTLGMELMNPLVQSISLPITINSAIRQLVADAPPAIKDQIRELTTAPRAGRALAVATGEYWSDIRNVATYQKVLSKRTLTEAEQLSHAKWAESNSGKFFIEMSDLGMIPPSTRQFMIEIGEVTNLREMTGQGLREKVIKAAELATTANRYTELFQRYAALRVADGIAQAANLTGTARNNMLHSFATQANGVFTSAQRPGLFQGALGSAFGLYKSYSINLMQALGRHIENRDYAALVSLGAVQGTIFGARSIPGAEQLNSLILAQNKEDQRDMYSTADIILGKAGGQALLYGLPSMFLGANMYSRGDLRPSSLLNNPFSIDSFPALNQFVNAGKAVAGAYSNMSNGAGVGNSLLDALAHQSLWRPAARAAEYVMGQQTTGQGTLIQNVDNSDGIFKWDLAVRLSGARPFDEAVLSDNYYRLNQYKLDKSAAMKSLNASTRLAISQGRELDIDDLANSFIEKGGNPREFRNWIRGRYRDMSIPAAEKMRQSLVKSGQAGFAQQLDLPSD